jgi:hypothetical protein
VPLKEAAHLAAHGMMLDICQRKTKLRFCAYMRAYVDPSGVLVDDIDPPERSQKRTAATVSRRPDDRDPASFGLPHDLKKSI